MNTSRDRKVKEISSILAQNFTTKINNARLKLIAMMILALCKVKTVSYVALSNAFDSRANPESSMRRIQRFMAEFNFPMEIVSKFIFNLLPKKNNLILVLDRTNWKFGKANINILMLGIAYKNMAIPIMFKMLDKRGNSHTEERIELMKQFIGWFGKDCIDCLLADREFIGDDWLNYLNNNGIRYYIRLRNNFKVYCFDKNQEKPVFWLFNRLKINEFCHHPKIVRMHGVLCYVSGLKVVNKDGKTDFLILVSFNKPQQALDYYKRRWEVETLFKAMKSSGFNIESTHVTDIERLEKLFMLVMIAIVWCYKVGDYLHTEVKEIKIKTHKRRATSVFKYGLEYINNVLLNFCNTQEINILKFLSCI